jgi:hypothetical protein
MNRRNRKRDILLNPALAKGGSQIGALTRDITTKAKAAIRTDLIYKGIATRFVPPFGVASAIFSLEQI